MEKEFVTYEIALALKELGFDEPCLAVFSDDECCDLIHVCENQMEGNFVIESFQYGTKAPLWQQVIDWLDSKNIFIDITYHESGKFYVSVNNECDISITNDLAFKKYDSRNQACEQAILKLIEIIKNN